MLVKGGNWNNWTAILGQPSKSTVTIQGKRTGLLLWTVGGALLKQELYGFLSLDTPLDGEPYPPGYVHLPMVDDEFCQQLVAEDLVTVTDKKGYLVRMFKRHRDRNEALDCRVYARAAAERCGLGRLVRPEGRAATAGASSKAKKAQDESERAGRGDWLGRRRRGGWL
jgi:phage terminase large subunit GpA-like protein